MDGALVAARFAHFAATMMLFGAAFYPAALAPASVAAELRPLLRRLAPALALVSLASAVAWLAFLTRSMAGELDLDTVHDVLTDTSFGVVWQARLALLALLLLATLWPDRRWRIPTLLAGLAMASLGLVGHAAMQEGAVGALHRLNHAAHLLTTSAWFGGLLPFWVCLRLFLKSERRDALAAMMRYSTVGHFVVAAVFATGAIDVALTAQALPWPPVTPWRFGLDGKIVIACAMTALALVNRYVFAPNLSRRPFAGRALAAGALAEIVLALGAIALVSAFATFDPHMKI